MGSNDEVFRNMRSNDVTFIINSNDNGHMGDSYGFTLARDRGRKAWTVTRLYYPPPSNVKHRIEMIITAREDNIGGSGIIETVRIEAILEKMGRISDEIEPVTLKGLDGEEYLVRIDRDGLQTDNVMDEKDRSPEFQLKVLAWSLHA